METVAQKVRRLKAEETIRDRQIKKLQRRLAAVRSRRAKVAAAIVRWTKSVKQIKRPFEVHVWNVANQSDRIGGEKAISLIVVHDTEGGTIDGIHSWFNNPRSLASSHVLVDKDGASVQFVPDARKAWHVMAFNSRALGIEQIGFATQDSWPEQQLIKTAEYIAYWSRKYGIPITHSTSHGVCQHKDLGVAGGGHDDCGPAYPFAHVLALARAMR